MTEQTETRQSQAKGLDGNLGYCPQCGTQTPLTEMVSGEVERQLGECFGEVKEPSQEIEKSRGDYIIHMSFGGIAKTVALFAAVNMIPYQTSGQRIAANLLGGMYTGGKIFSALGQDDLVTELREYLSSISQRLKIKKGK